MNWDRLNAVTNVLVIVGALIFLFRPEGPATRTISEHLQRMEERETVQAHWVELADTESVIPSQADRVGIVVFADYQCSFCQKAHAALRTLVEEHPSTGVAYRHYPVDAIHPEARSAALAAICAEDQGRFPQMNGYLYRNTAWENDPDWERVAQSVDIPDVDRFLTCMESDDARTRLDTDLELAEKLEIRSTPAFVHRDGIRRGLAPGSELSEWMGTE